MSADEPSPGLRALPDVGPDRWAALERDLAAARLAGSAPERAEHLARLETGLLAAVAEAPAPDGEREPLLAACVRWREACAEAAPEVCAALEERIGSGLAAAADALREGALGPAVRGDPSALVAALRAAADLEREALDLRAAPTAGDPPLVDLAPVRAALVSALAASPPQAPARAAWVRDLEDRVAAVRAGLDELDPARAARLLRRTADDVAWHRAHVEPGRGALSRRLARAERRLTAAAQERELEARLESRFGPARTARWERLVLFAILTVVGLLVLEWAVALPLWGRVALAVVDTLACGVLLTDFFVRLAHVRGRWRWFLRHVWLDFLPSLPLTWLALAHVAGESLHASAGLRFLQLPRFARTLRALLPLLRVLRAIGFLVRGVDRLARAYGRFLDRDLILHPTREERRAVARVESGSAARALELRAALEAEWVGLLGTSAPDERAAVARARLAVLDGAAAASGPLAVSPRGLPTETTAEAQIERWARATPEAVAVRLEPDLLRRLARNVRLFARPPLRWTPFVRRYLPRLAPGMDDAAVVAAAARAAAAEMRRHQRRWLWFSDLYGTLTPAEFVDRLGTALVRSSFRPAYRLTIFGGIYLIVLLLIGLIGAEAGFLHWLSGSVLRPLVGPVLLVLGGICFAILGVGWWMKRTASQATAYFEALTGAQFLELMETVKCRALERDARILERRVLAAEARLAGAGPEASAARARALADRVRAWLLDRPGEVAHGSDAEARVALLYRDALDGGLFLEGDARTARQLQGNPVLAGLRRRSGRVDAAERRALRRLDFDHPTSTLRGPYLWFSFLAQAVVQTVGRLLADYHRAVLPLADLATAAPEERARFEAWLVSRHAESAAAPGVPRPPQGTDQLSGDFLALHFLDDDPGRDRDVEARYGPRVLAHLRADRRFLVRRIFGTYPLHLRPRAERLLNLRQVYEGWLSRGRALLVPFRLAWRALRFTGTLLRWIGRAIGEVRRPALRASAEEAAQADFATALRKIDRARGPLADACLWLRARLDAEYLGLAGPATGAEGPADVEPDLAFLGDRAVLQHRVAEERVRARADIERLARLEAAGLSTRLAERLGGGGSFGPEHRRALLAAYRMDLDGVRTLVSAEEVLAEAVAAAATRPLAARCPLRRWRRWRAFRAWWPRSGLSGDVKRVAWRVVAHDVSGAGRCLDALRRFGAAGARERGEARLAEQLRHPARITEMLVTLRTVQTLSLLDILTYREHVHRVGRYAESGDDAGDRLTLSPEPPRATAASA